MIKAILAGICMSIASFMYLQIGGVLGAILFSSGLLLILNMEFKLFTGTIGYISTQHDVIDNIIILIGNLLGSLAALYIPQEIALDLVIKKLSIPLPIIFYKSIICGALIYIAVDCFKNKKVYMVPVCVVAFILYQAEHCIADFCFMIAARELSISFMIIAILGNSIGAIALHKLEYKNKNKDKGEK